MSKPLNSFSKLIRSWFKPHKSAPFHRRRVRLTFECLEGRIVPSVNTITTVAASVDASPASTLTYGTTATLTATISAVSGSTAPAAGSVDFLDGSTDLGAVFTDTESGNTAIFTLITDHPTKAYLV